MPLAVIASLLIASLSFVHTMQLNMKGSLSSCLGISRISWLSIPHVMFHARWLGCGAHYDAV